MKRARHKRWIPIAASAVLHGALVFAAGRSESPRPTHEPVMIEIVTPAPREAVAPVVVQPRPPAPPPPVAARAAPVVRPPRPITHPPTSPVPAPVAAAAPSAPAPGPVSPGGEGIAVAAGSGSAAPGTPAPVVPSPSLPVAPAVAQVGPADLSGYLGSVRGLVGRHRRYPEMAARMGQEGSVAVRVRVNADGSLLGRPVVIASSGFELLDEEALRMVQRAAPFPQLPSRRAEEITVPVNFQLEE